MRDQIADYSHDFSIVHAFTTRACDKNSGSLSNLRGNKTTITIARVAGLIESLLKGGVDVYASPSRSPATK